MLKVKYKILFFLLALLVILSGCSNKGKVISKAGITTLHFIDLGIPDEIKRMNPLIQRFEGTHPGVKVQVQYSPGASEVRQKILLMTTAGMPLDIVYLNDTAFPEFVSRGIFQPLDELIAKDKSFNLNAFYPHAIEAATFNGKIYGIPPTYATLIIFYNKTLFAKQGIPFPKDGWSWDEFRADARKLTLKKDGSEKPEQYGALGIELWFWMPMIFQNGGRILDKKGVCVFNSKKVIEALQFVKDMYTKDKVFSMAPSGIEGVNGAYLFGTGKIAMMEAPFGVFKDFPKSLDWDIVAPPEKKGGKKYFHGGFWGYALTSRSKHKKLAWEFLKFLTSKEVIKEWMVGIKEKKWGSMGGPSRKSLRDVFLSILPDKHLESYLYALQYPGFSLAHPWGTAIINEVANKYSIQDNLEGITKESLKVLLDKFTKEVNDRLGK